VNRVAYEPSRIKKIEHKGIYVGERAEIIANTRLRNAFEAFGTTSAASVPSKNTSYFPGRNF
jgi:hypothetical protein